MVRKVDIPRKVDALRQELGWSWDEVFNRVTVELEYEKELANRPEPTEDDYLCPVCDSYQFEERTELHHTSYDPEEVMRVCHDCHTKIHHEDGFRDDLLPDMKRPDDAKIVGEV